MKEINILASKTIAGFVILLLKKNGYQKWHFWHLCKFIFPLKILKCSPVILLKPEKI
jgi:hypothetical protein